MKLKRISLQALFFVLLMLVFCPVSLCAKRVQTDKMYLFGFAASFKDSVVYMTEIQELHGVWVDTKTRFLLGREHYSSQLKEYLSSARSEPNRVCIVMFATDRKKAERRFIKLRSKYTSPKLKRRYEVRHIGSADFKFQPVTVNEEQQ